MLESDIIASNILYVCVRNNYLLSVVAINGKSENSKLSS